MPEPILTPRGDNAPLDATGFFTRLWYLFFQSITNVVADFVTNAVYGKPVLLHPDLLTQVTSAGTIGESILTANTVQRGISSVQANLAALALTLHPADSGFLAFVTDYAHTLRWSGTAWTWGPGEDGRHDIAGLPVDPNPLAGWQLCDGTATTYLNGDGTTGNYVTPNLTGGAAYLKLGAAVTGINGAVAPVFTGTAGPVTGTVGAILGTVSGGVAAGAGTVAAPLNHTHAAPSFTGNALTPAGKVSALAEPANVVLRPWFRR